MKRWQKLEFQDAKDSSGKRRKRSGALWFEKGDVATDTYLIDDKDALDAEYYAIKFAQFEKHVYEAQREGLIGIIKVFFRDELGRKQKLIIAEPNLIGEVTTGRLTSLAYAVDQKSYTVNFKKWQEFQKQELPERWKAHHRVIEVTFTDSRGKERQLVVMSNELFEQLETKE